MQNIRVMIIESRFILREGIMELLGPAKDISIIGSSTSCKAAQELLEKQLCDVILLGNNDLWLDEIPALCAIQANHLKIHTLLFFDNMKDGYYGSPLAQYADSYVPMHVDGSNLANLIRRTANDISATAKRKKTSSLKRPFSLHPHLSNRELQIICLMGQGKSITQIARQMRLSSKTISTFRHRAMTKLGYENNAQLMLYALKNGLGERITIPSAVHAY
jgi:two-component system, NarL family, invasion response regulator UvrY